MLHLTPSECGVHDRRISEVLTVAERRSGLLRAEPTPAWVAPVRVPMPLVPPGRGLRPLIAALVVRVRLRPAA